MDPDDISQYALKNNNLPSQALHSVYAFFYFLFLGTDKNFIKSKVNLAGV